MKRTILAIIFMSLFITLVSGQNQKTDSITFTFGEPTGSSRVVYVIPIVINGQKTSTDFDFAEGYINTETNDTTITAHLYCLPFLKEGKEIECIGCVDTDIPAFIFLVPSNTKIFYDDLEEAKKLFIKPFESSDENLSVVFSKATKASHKRIEKHVGACEISKYNIRSGHYTLKYSGTLDNPLDFMVEYAIKRHIEKKAKKFGYTKSTKVEHIRSMLDLGDHETIEFVNAYLNDNL